MYQWYHSAEGKVSIIIKSKINLINFYFSFKPSDLQVVSEDDGNQKNYLRQSNLDVNYSNLNNVKSHFPKLINAGT